MVRVFNGAPVMAQLVKNPPAMQETPVPYLGWEDTLEKGQATHSSILAWRIPVSPGKSLYSLRGRKESSGISGPRKSS